MEAVGEVGQYGGVVRCGGERVGGVDGEGGYGGGHVFWWGLVGGGIGVDIPRVSLDAQRVEEAERARGAL